MSEQLPSILAYPRILDVEQVPELVGPGPPRHLVYVLRDYADDGLTVVIRRHPATDKINVQLGNFDGENLLKDSVLGGISAEFMSDDVYKFIGLMKALRLEQAIFYLAYDGELRLVDIRLSLDKFCGPGMIRDLFGKIYPIQDIVKVVPLDENELANIKAGKEPYAGNLIIKCSTFKTITRGKEMLPLYARIRRPNIRV